MPMIQQDRIFAAVGNESSKYWSTLDSDPKARYDWPVGLDAWPTGDQSTYSWRTKARNKGNTGNDLNEDPGAFTQTSGSLLGFYSELERRDKEDTGRFGNTDRTGATYDTGHEFRTSKREITRFNENSSAYRVAINYNENLHYVGPIRLVVPGSESTHYPTVPDYSPNQVKLDGAAAIRRTIPTNPVAGLAQFIGELHDLPQLPIYMGLRDKYLSQGLGSEYLNAQFGIAPFISDIRKIAYAVLHTGRILRQLKRDSSLRIKRKVRLEDRTTSDQWTVSGCSIYMPSCNGRTNMAQQFYDYGSPADVAQVFETVRSQTWFSAEFTYFLPLADDLISRLEYFDSKANRLLGSDITPETIWQLTPWSWMIDWYTSVGNVIHNGVALSSDNLVLRYGYLMHQTDATREYRISGLKPWPNTGPGNQFPHSVGTQYSIRVKERHRATPYGFGFDMGALSPYQSAILGALGLTRAPGVLRNS